MNTIGFIGAGHMASSLVGGLCQAGFDSRSIWVSDPDINKVQALIDRWGIQAASNNQDLVHRVEVVLFAVKPQVMASVVSGLSSVLQQHQPLVISIAAGINLSAIAQWIGSDNLPMVRCMPNTPALLGAAATGLYANASVTTHQRALAESILRAVGLTVWFDHEMDLNIVTALSGSGPAYFFLLMEAMQAAAIQLGLSADAAKLLTVQTALGAAKMALELNNSVSELRQQVTSPGGTTERALTVLAENNFMSVISKAISAATQRAEELAQSIEGKK